MGQGREIGPNERDFIGAGGVVVWDAHCRNPGAVVARVCGVAILRIVLPGWMAGKFADLVIGGVIRDLVRDVYGVSTAQTWTRTILRAANFAGERARTVGDIFDETPVPARALVAGPVDRWVPEVAD